MMTPEEKQRYEDLSMQADSIRMIMRTYREELREIRLEMAHLRSLSADRCYDRHAQRYNQSLSASASSSHR